MSVSGCPLCETDGGLLIFKNDQLRVVQVSEADFPAAYRVVWNAHVPEFSSLSLDERNSCMSAVVTVELELREQLKPTKINLAALGNAVPHLHWHVIARFDWDSHFAGSVWAAPQRVADVDKLKHLALQCESVNRLLAAKLAA